MGLFRNHSSKKKTDPPLLGPHGAPAALSRSSSLKSVGSAASFASTGNSKFKSFLKKTSPEPQVPAAVAAAINFDTFADSSPKKASPLAAPLEDDFLHMAISPPPLTKRISTIVETLDADESGGLEFEDEEIDADEATLAGSYAHGKPADHDTDDDDDGYDHLHTIKSKARAKHLNLGHNGLSSQINSFMVYCGLANTKMADIANIELRRTFSLLDAENLKIHTLSATTNRAALQLREPVISDHQLEVISLLTEKLSLLHELKGNPQRQYELAQTGKTVYDRYGAVTRVIGRGSFGLIKIIDPVSNGVVDTSLEEADLVPPPCTKKLYAVKEILRRGTEKAPELLQLYIERVLSEFVVSSTLNYKHIVKSVDLMVTLPPLDTLANGTANGNSASANGHSNHLAQYLKVSQVMECTPGGDLFTYMSNTQDRFGESVSYMALEEIDCFIKQIAKGIWYMHQHGVAHCDLKLENVLLSYMPCESNLTEFGPRELESKLFLKLSDFGSANVFRTKWDKTDQLLPFSKVPIGSESYIAPEEYGGFTWCSAINLAPCLSGYSPAKKDNWALGILILVLFNLRKNYYSRNMGVSSTEGGSGYIWHSTEPKNHKLRKEKLYRDKIFEDYVNKRMIADYECKTKEWLIHRKGAFAPIETLFDPPRDDDDDDDDDDKTHFSDEEMDEDEKELCELRKYFIYKLLDPDPSTRLTVEQFLKSDWMRGVESCV